MIDFFFGFITCLVLLGAYTEYHIRRGRQAVQELRDRSHERDKELLAAMGIFRAPTVGEERDV